MHIRIVLSFLLLASMHPGFYLIPEIAAQNSAPPAPPPQAKPSPGKVSFKDGSIFLARTGESQPEKIYSDERLVQYFAISLSQSGELIAVRGDFKDTTSEAYKKYDRPSKALLVLSSQGEVLYKAEWVIAFSWSPLEDRLVYIEEQHAFHETDAILGIAVWVLDPRSGEKEDIGPALLKSIAEDVNWSSLRKQYWFHDVTWAAFDSKIYVELGGVFRYDPATGRADPTPYHDLDFSPDGEYYFHSSLEGEPAKLYHRRTNQEIAIKGISGDRSRLSYRRIGWQTSGGRTFALLWGGMRPEPLWRLDCATGVMNRLLSPGHAAGGCSAYCESHSVFLRSAGSGGLEKIFSSDSLFIEDLKVSPSGKALAVLAAPVKRSPEWNQTSFWPKVLLLLSAAGEVLQRIEGAVSFAWSPEGGRLAYIEPYLFRNRLAGPRGKAIQVLDLSTGQRKRIEQEDTSRFYSEISWAAFDGKIYVSSWKRPQTQPIFRIFDIFRLKLDPESGKEISSSKSTAIKSRLQAKPLYRNDRAIHFSPDGRYYFVESHESGAVPVYRSGTNEAVKAEHLQERPLLLLSLLGWEQRDGKTFAYIYSMVGTTVQLWRLDCASGALSVVTAPEGALRPLGVADGRVSWVRVAPDGSYEAVIE